MKTLLLWTLGAAAGWFAVGVVLGLIDGDAVSASWNAVGALAATGIYYILRRR
jgi:hypothetical protein